MMKLAHVSYECATCGERILLPPAFAGERSALGTSLIHIAVRCGKAYIAAMSDRLERLWHEQDGRCFYCDGPTYVPSIETKDQARKRLAIEPGITCSAKLLNQHIATVEHLSRKMVCKFCNCHQGGGRSIEAHKRSILAKVAAETHPVNRLVEEYGQGRLSWRPLSGSGPQT
jgi:DNA-directed RNA polymerase subunit RPC12/RpoP